MKINELAQKCDINAETIRYYEKIGLLGVAKRSANGYRSFDENTVRELEFIKTCRSLGFTIDEIRQLQQLQNNPDENCHNANELVAQHLLQVQQKITQLYEIQAFLQSVADCSHHLTKDCKVLNSLWNKAKSGQ